MNWLETKNIFITRNDLDGLMLSENNEAHILDILNWAYERGIIPTHQGIDYAIRCTSLNIIQWLEEHELPYTIESFL